METFVYKERLDRYLKAPLFTIGILLIVDFWSYTKSVNDGPFFKLAGGSVCRCCLGTVSMEPYQTLGGYH